MDSMFIFCPKLHPNKLHNIIYYNVHRISMICTYSVVHDNTSDYDDWSFSPVFVDELTSSSWLVVTHPTFASFRSVPLLMYKIIIYCFAQSFRFTRCPTNRYDDFLVLRTRTKYYYCRQCHFVKRYTRGIQYHFCSNINCKSMSSCIV